MKSNSQIIVSLLLILLRIGITAGIVTNGIIYLGSLSTEDLAFKLEIEVNEKNQ